MLLTAVIVVWCTFAADSELVCAENEETKPEGIENSLIRYVSTGVHRIAIHAEAVLTDKYDPGIGFGFTDWRDLGTTRFVVLTEVNFWGASQDSLDMLSAGIEESVMAKTVWTDRLAFLGGVSLGYFRESESFETNRGGTPRTSKDISSSFKAYVLIGTEYVIQRKRTMYFFVKYGIVKYGGTGEFSELHCIAGISFSR